MHQIPELENLGSFKAALDSELPFFSPDKGLQRSELPHLDLSFIQRRDRIDSEDFTLPIKSKPNGETDFLQAHGVTPREPSQPLEPPAQRKSSTLPPIDPNLIGLEVP